MSEYEKEGLGRVDDKTMKEVYDELGRQIEKMDDVLEAYREQDLEHTDSFEQLEARSSRFRMMRGVLQESADETLRENDVEDLLNE